MEVGKRWRLARDGGWQEVEVGKRWRLARDGGWQEVEVDLYQIILIFIRLIEMLTYARLLLTFIR